MPDPWDILALQARERMANQEFASRNRESQLASRKAIMDALNQGLATGVGAYGKYVDDQNARQQREQDMAFRREQFDYGKASDARDAALSQSGRIADAYRADKQLALSQEQFGFNKSQALAEAASEAEAARRQQEQLDQLGEYLGLKVGGSNVGGFDMAPQDDSFRPSQQPGAAPDSFRPAPPQGGDTIAPAPPSPSPEAQALSKFGGNPLIQKAVMSEMDRQSEFQNDLALAIAKKQAGQEPTFEEKERIRAQMKLALQVTDPRNRTATPEQKQEAAAFIQGAHGVLAGGGQPGVGAMPDDATIGAKLQAKLRRPVTPADIEEAKSKPHVLQALMQ